MRGVFGPRGRNLGVREAIPGDTAEGGRAKDKDFIDSRAPHDLKVEQAMRAAEAAIRRKDWKSSQELLQKLLDLPEDSLHRLPDGRWQSVRRTANRLLGTAPPAVLDDYRTQYAGLAQQLLNEAKRSGRSADYVHVATRFLHTPAGYEAANYLGSLHFDRGEFGLAAAWFDEISESSADFTSQGSWRLKAAVASRQAGDTKSSNSLLRGLDETTKPVSLGLGAVDPSTWIKGLSGVLPSRSVALADWTQIYGTAARVGTAVGGAPLLSPIWSVPLTSSHAVRRRVDWLLQDLLDQDRTPLMASMPLVVDGRAIYRDLRGVRSVDIQTGRTMWESVEGVSAERIIGGLPPQQVEPQSAWRFRANQFQLNLNEYQGQSAEYHPLASLLFRDGIYGVISSDGRQVFVLEDHGILSRNQPGQHWGWDGSNEPQDPFGVPWKTNRLVSYDIRTGRTRWSVGGVESNESFDLPLAGSFFYGTPAVDGDELLVVAGKGDDIRLWSLDRSTGTPRWSQLIAYSDTKIEQDIGRRWFTAQIASDGGILVCPTTVGWLVAVDRLRQSVLWAHRYLPPSSSQERDPSTQFVPQRDLSSQWPPSAPVISGSVVVYTPPEEPIILALNMLDGRRLWEKPKDTWLYLAGVFDDQAVLVGGSEIAAFAVTTGKQIWSSPLGEYARPSGRGLAVDDQYYLPLTTGELRVVNLKTGKTASQSYVPSSHPPLGNLAMHRGKLVALGTQGLVGFGQREAVVAEIQRRKSQNPNDAWAMLREAEILLLNRDHEAALPLLRKMAVEELTDAERSRRHTELIECLASVIRLDPKSHQEELAELDRVAQTADERRLHQELTADHLMAQSRFVEAFDVIWSLLDTQDADAVIPRVDDPQITMSRNVWLAGRLTEIWTAAAGAEREMVDAKIVEILSRAVPKDEALAPKIVSVLGFHPAAVRLREQLVDELAANKDFGGAQLELLKLASDANRSVAARANVRMAQLLEQFGLPIDAAYFYRILERDYADIVLEDGLTSGELVKRLARKRRST